MVCRSLALVVSAALLAFSCADAGEAGPIEPANAALGDPAAEVALPALVVALDEVGTLSRLGGVVVLGTSDGLFEVGPEGLEPVRVVRQRDDEPQATGAVLALGPLPDDELAVVTEAGVYYTADRHLLRSPASGALEGLEIRALGGHAEALWMATTEGLFTLREGALERVELPGVDDAPSGLAATEQTIAVDYAGALWALDPATLEARPVISAPARALVASDGVIYAATDEGVLVGQGDSWTRYALGAVDAMGAHPEGGVVVALGAALWAVGPEGAVAIGAVEAPGEGIWGLGLDGEGDVVLGTAEGLALVQLSEPVGFEAEVAPVLGAWCQGCHMDGSIAPKRDFTDYELVVALSDTIFERIATGLMPPEPSPGLSDEDYATLVAWLEGGMAP